MDRIQNIKLSELMSFARDKFKLELIWGDSLIDKCLITEPYVQKPGLALAGYFAHIHKGRIQVFGATEISYIKTLSDESAKKSLLKLFKKNQCCAIISKAQEIPDVLLDVVKALDIPILRSVENTRQTISFLVSYLEDVFALSTTIHGVFMDVYGVGTLITGKSGIGKSECAIELIKRGHMLVADDVIMVYQKPDRLLGSSNELLRYHIELRGMGIVNVRDMFGVSAIRLTKDIEFVINFTIRSDDDVSDRLGLDETYMEILSHKVPLITCPLSPGRNMASIVEVAARNYLLKTMGYDSSKAFLKKADERFK